MDELHDLGIEDPDLDYVPEPLRRADGERVLVAGIDLETGERKQETGSLFIAPEFFVWAARRRTD